MSLDADIRTLSAVDLFSELTSEQLRLLAFGAETMRFSNGRVLFREGDRADCAYVVARGAVALTRQGESDEIVVARLGAGSLLGEMALIADTRRLTNAVAEGDIEAIRLNRSLFRRILEEYPDLAARLHARIAADLEAMLRRIEALAPRFSD